MAIAPILFYLLTIPLDEEKIFYFKESHASESLLAPTRKYLL